VHDDPDLSGRTPPGRIAHSNPLPNHSARERSENGYGKRSAASLQRRAVDEPPQCRPDAPAPPTQFRNILSRRTLQSSTLLRHFPARYTRRQSQGLEAVPVSQEGNIQSCFRSREAGAGGVFVHVGWVCLLHSRR
jgi:hypothetical protein